MFVIETMAFPPIEVMRLYRHWNSVFIEQHEHYNKRSYRNRYDLLGPQGMLPLVIPLRRGKNNAQSITDVQIAHDTAWPVKHLNAIKSCYGNAPYFDEYYPLVEAAYSDIPPTLFAFNLRALCSLVDGLGLETSIHLTPYFIPYDAEDMTVAKDQYTPRSIVHHPNEPYIQVFSDRMPFVPGLSILDLLFNTGPESRLYLAYRQTHADVGL